MLRYDLYVRPDVLAKKVADPPVDDAALQLVCGLPWIDPPHPVFNPNDRFHFDIEEQSHVVINLSSSKLQGRDAALKALSPFMSADEARSLVDQEDLILKAVRSDPKIAAKLLVDPVNALLDCKVKLTDKAKASLIRSRARQIKNGGLLDFDQVKSVKLVADGNDGASVKGSNS